MARKTSILLVYDGMYFGIHWIDRLGLVPTTAVSWFTMETGDDSMREKLLSTGLMAALLAVPRLALPQAAQQKGTLMVTRQPGETPVLQMNGRSYVDIEALARLANGCLALKGQDADKQDPLDQQNLSCARALAAMAASGQFQDDGPCH